MLVDSKLFVYLTHTLAAIQHCQVIVECGLCELAHFSFTWLKKGIHGIGLVRNQEQFIGMLGSLFFFLEELESWSYLNIEFSY